MRRTVPPPQPDNSALVVDAPAASEVAPFAAAGMPAVVSLLPTPALGHGAGLRRKPGERCACGGITGADGRCNRCQAAAARGDTTVGLERHSRQAANAAVARLLAGDRRTIARMVACPPRLRDDEATPSGWKDYHGDPGWFHCGFRGILENRSPTPEDPMNECFYDHTGALVDENHPYAGCRGTPDQYDSATSPVSHAVRDSGGILAEGGPAFMTSRVHDIDQAIAGAIGVVQAAATVVRSLAEGFAEAVALGVLTGVATVDPGNWVAAGLPARSMAHLNVMGAVLTSAALAGNVETMLRNLTRRLSDFPIQSLLDDLAADINQAQPPGPGGSGVTAGSLGGMSMFQLVELLNTRGLLRFQRPPEEIARARLAAERASAQPAR